MHRKVVSLQRMCWARYSYNSFVFSSTLSLTASSSTLELVWRWWSGLWMIFLCRYSSKFDTKWWKVLPVVAFMWNYFRRYERGVNTTDSLESLRRLWTSVGCSAKIDTKRRKVLPDVVLGRITVLICVELLTIYNVIRHFFGALFRCKAIHDTNYNELAFWKHVSLSQSTDKYRSFEVLQYRHKIWRTRLLLKDQVYIKTKTISH